jgi:hypothetical protein
MTCKAEIPINLQPDNFDCLNLEEKARIVTCFEQNSACHKALSEASQPPSNIQIPIAVGALALAAGLFIGFKAK